MVLDGDFTLGGDLGGILGGSLGRKPAVMRGGSLGSLGGSLGGSLAKVLGILMRNGILNPKTASRSKKVLKLSRCKQMGEMIVVPYTIVRHLDAKALKNFTTFQMSNH